MEQSSLKTECSCSGNMLAVFSGNNNVRRRVHNSLPATDLFSQPVDNSPCAFPLRHIFRSFSQDCEKRLLASSCLSVCLPAWNSSASTGWIFMKFDSLEFFENLTRITGTLHEDQYTLFLISHSVLLIMKNV